MTRKPHRDESAAAAAALSTTAPIRKPRGRTPLLHSIRACAIANGPHGLAPTRCTVNPTKPGSVG